MSVECPFLSSRARALPVKLYCRTTHVYMDVELSGLKQKIQQHEAEISLLKAQQARPHASISPWLPLKEASVRLNFISDRALRNRIKNGQFPPDCVRIDPTSSSRFPKYLVNVERYIKQLR